MSQSDIRAELQGTTVEPLLPIEKRLIAASLGTGIALLIVLALVARIAPF
jgi:hypothetical protein